MATTTTTTATITIAALRRHASAARRALQISKHLFKRGLEAAHVFGRCFTLLARHFESGDTPMILAALRQSRPQVGGQLQQCLLVAHRKRPTALLVDHFGDSDDVPRRSLDRHTEGAARHVARQRIVLRREPRILVCVRSVNDLSGGRGGARETVRERHA